MFPPLPPHPHLVCDKPARKGGSEKGANRACCSVRDMTGLSSSVLHYCMSAGNLIKACVQMWTPQLLCFSRFSSLLGWVLPCFAVLCMHRDYDHESYITLLSKGNQKLGVGRGYSGLGVGVEWWVLIHQTPPGQPPFSFAIHHQKCATHEKALPASQTALLWAWTCAYWCTVLMAN